MGEGWMRWCLAVAVLGRGHERRGRAEASYGADGEGQGRTGGIQGAHPAGFCAIAQGRIWAFAKRIRMAYSDARQARLAPHAKPRLAWISQAPSSLERSGRAPGRIPRCTSLGAQHPPSRAGNDKAAPRAAAHGRGQRPLSARAASLRAARHDSRAGSASLDSSWCIDRSMPSNLSRRVPRARFWHAPPRRAARPPTSAACVNSGLLACGGRAVLPCARATGAGAVKAAATRIAGESTARIESRSARHRDL